MHRVQLLCAAFLVAGAATGAHAGGTYTVPDAAQGWQTIQDAVDAVPENAIIWVVPGDYPPFDFNGRALTVMAHPGFPAPPAGSGPRIVPTVAGTGMVIDSGEGAGSVLDGIVFEGANAGDDEGGAIRIVASAPTIRNCTFRLNNARNGGAVHVTSGNPTFDNCIFDRNTALHVFQGDVSSLGGAVALLGSGATFTGCTFTQNSTTADTTHPWGQDKIAHSLGGAIYASGTFPVTISGCTFLQNSSRAVCSGAGFFGQLPLRDALGAGGGLYAGGGGALITIENTTFEGNAVTATANNLDDLEDTMATTSPVPRGLGGAIYCPEGSVSVIDGCTFRNNVAEATGNLEQAARSHGGAICCSGVGTSPTIGNNCNFVTNRVSTSGGPPLGTNDLEGGGAIASLDGATPIVSDSTFTGPFATAPAGFDIDLGGAIYNEGGHPSFTACTFTGLGAELGGAAYSTAKSNYTFTGCVFTGNFALAGGAIANSRNWVDSSGSGPGRGEVDSCEFTGNIAIGDSDPYGGGAMYNFQSSPLVRDCTFTTNRSFFDGGAMSNLGTGGEIGSFPLTENCVFCGNTATRHGGGMFNAENLSLAVVRGCEFRGNLCVMGSGGEIHNLDDLDHPGLSLIGTTTMCENLPYNFDDMNDETVGQVVGQWTDEGYPDITNFPCQTCVFPCDTVTCTISLLMGDTNADTIVNLLDIVNVILDWGTNGAAHGGDVSGDAMGSAPDGIVNTNDLNTVIVNWSS